MLKYFSKIEKNNQVYSCDMIRITFCADKCRFNEIAYFINFDCGCRPDVEIYPMDTRFAHYKYLVTFRYDDEATMTCGCGFNGPRAEDNFRGFVEFNPNKVADIDQFQKDFAFLRSCFGVYEVPRIDVAVDLPSKRENVFLRKDSRKYRLDYKSAPDKSEYLGVRNTPGRVKVYNKSLESKLAQPLTRIEITTEPTIDDFRKHIPEVYDFGIPVQQTLFQTLNKTDQVLLDLLLAAIVENRDHGMNLFNSLGRSKREKLKPFILPEAAHVKYDLDCVRQLFDNIRQQFQISF